LYIGMYLMYEDMLMISQDSRSLGVIMTM
jgi:hypothetical protein